MGMRHNSMRHNSFYSTLYVFVFIISLLLSPFTVSSVLAEKKVSSKVEKKDKKKNKLNKSELFKRQKNSKSRSKVKRGLPSKEYKESDFRPKVNQESYAWMVIKTLLVLGLIVGGFYVFFKFVTKKTGMQLRGQDVARILSVVPIGQNKYIQIIDLAGKVLVLGVADSGINLITEITEKDEKDRIRLLSSKDGSVKRQGFQEYIAKNIGRLFEKMNEQKTAKNEIPEGEFDSGVDLAYLRRQKKRLKTLNGTED